MKLIAFFAFFLFALSAMACSEDPVGCGDRIFLMKNVNHAVVCADGQKIEISDGVATCRCLEPMPAPKVIEREVHVEVPISRWPLYLFGASLLGWIFWFAFYRSVMSSMNQAKKDYEEKRKELETVRKQHEQEALNYGLKLADLDSHLAKKANKAHER